MPGRSDRSRIVLALGVAFTLGLIAPVRSDEPAAGGTEAQSVEDRLKALETMNRQLLEQYHKLSDRETHERTESERRYRDLERRYDELKVRVERPPTPAPTLPEALESGPAPRPEPPESVPAEVTRSIEESLREAATRGPASDQPEAPWGQPLGLHAHFDEGFVLASPHDEYTLGFHILNQTDFKDFVPNNQSPARSGLYEPRVRVYFEGTLTKPFEYEVSLQRSIDGSWDLLDASLNVNRREGFQIKFGRMLTPYSYEWYDHLEQYFIAPERPLFPLNFGLARQAGLMAHGFLFDGRLQYAVGGFDGHLVGVADNNTTSDCIAYLNSRPFLLTEEHPWLRNFNVGGSIFGGIQYAPQNPLPLRTSLQSAENDENAQHPSSIFLQFNEDTFALGRRSGAALHTAWYYHGISIESEYQNAFINMARAGVPGQTTVPIQGYHVTLAYFLTGEEVERRTTVYPLRPFDLTHGQWGPGAVEAFVRYSQLDLGKIVFADGLADRRDWSTDGYMVDMGFNWYLNPYIKLYFDWQHITLGKPVLINPATDVFSRYNDMFWVRCQVYF